jgi:FkbM family methyltransferase
MRIELRDALARALRGVPQFKGKGRLGIALQDLLTDYATDDECIVSFRMRDQSLMRVDLRSYAERYPFWTGEHDLTIRRLVRVLEPGSTVLDVGANIGFYAVPFGRALRASGGSVYAFEPFPSNYERLAEVVRLNSLQATVVSVRLALGEQSGRIPLALQASAGARTGNAAREWRDVHTTRSTLVRCEPLDEVADELGIASCALIKVDIEGGELDFFKGAAEFIQRHRPLLYCELNYPWMELAGWSFREFVDVISPWGYRVYRSAGRTFVPAMEPGTGIENVLSVPRGAERDAVTRRLLGLEKANRGG